MNKFGIVGVSAIASFFVACSEPQSDVEEETIAGVELEEAAPLIETGLDMSLLDQSVRPQDDLWAYVNGKWVAEAVIPDDQTRWGGFATLRKETDEQVKVLLDDLLTRNDLEQDSEAQKIRDFYMSVLNRDLIEEKGTTPIQSMLDDIAVITDKQAYFLNTAKLSRDGITTPIAPFIYVHPEESTRYIVQIYQDGIGLPTREYYFDEGEKFDTVRAAYKVYLADLLRLSGIESSDEKALQVYDFEVKLAEAQWTRTQNRDVSQTNNVLKLDEMSTIAAGLDWTTWFDALGIHSTDEVRVYQPSYFTALEGILNETDLETLKAYAQLRIIRNYARYLPEEIRKVNFVFLSDVLYGASQEPEQWERAVRDINVAMGEALGKVYVDQYFPPEAKARMDELVANLYSAFELSIDRLDWMSDETKLRAQEKLTHLGPMIGYPDKWEDYSALEILPDDIVGNLLRSSQFVHDRELKRLGKPIDKEEWVTNPQTVNAFHVPARNQIFFPAGYLQPPNFFLSGDDAVNYGAIGSTIGHEIGHAFDDQGRKYDKDGNIADWWTEEDAAAYKAKAQKLIDQYSAYEPIEGVFINGELNLGENIGDLTGLTLALRAYHLSLNGEEAPVIDGLTGDQRFFISYAQSSRIKTREDALRDQVIRGPHFPGEYRVKTISNMPEFYEAFDVKEGDGMYFAPEDRVAIWE